MNDTDMINNWLKDNTATQLHGHKTQSTLKRDANGKIVGRRDTIKVAKKKLAQIRSR